MRRAFLLISVVGAPVLAAVAWLPAAQLGGNDGTPQAPVPAEVSAQGTTQAKVDLNQAGLEELTRLPGITMPLAERITRHRPYRKLDDLVTRNVLGKKQFARIREFVVIGRGAP
jgi:DNA uptake protein ComE-like DNA-binding protein